MKKILSTLGVVLAVLFLIRWIVWPALLTGVTVPDESDFQIDLAAVRSLALEQGEQNLPLRINTLIVADAVFPEWTLYGRRRMPPQSNPDEEATPDHNETERQSPSHVETQSELQTDSQSESERAALFQAPAEGVWISIPAFQVVYPEDSILIDGAYDRVLHAELMGARDFDSNAYQRLQKEILRAQLILFTHEHYDHMGGVARSPHLYDIRDRLLITEAQMRSSLITDARFPPAVLEVITPIDYQGMYSPAPGIVLLPAPGHTPGSQMIYVRLIGGREFLFIGDVVFQEAQLSERFSLPRLTTTVASMDADAIAGQIQALHVLMRDSDVQVVVSHDFPRLIQLMRSGALGEGFEDI
ncbi:MAG: MBL fold metallo-hydrolase [Leptospiraceae bacterium]|nr:MBL fold metallo-hydrolase [Leptospiraceae bacterium]